MKVDYTPEQVHDLYVFLQQFIQHERNPVYRGHLEKILAIVRGIDTIGQGTAFITERAEQDFHAAS